ncbi:MAG: OmpA family protein [Bacteroidetes bacterium]|nr:MAG: OmpA family protein [Bacteroidota bacterium]
MYMKNICLMLLACMMCWCNAFAQIESGGMVGCFRDPTIYFDLNSSAWKQAHETVLQNVLKFMLEKPEYMMEISGYSTSDEKNGQELSEMRAQVAGDYFIARGIPKDRLVIVGYSHTRPDIPEESDKKGENRRVEFYIHYK